MGRVRFGAIMVGTFPPPVHGMAMVNSAVRAQLQQFESELLVINVAGRSLDRSVTIRLGRLPRVLRGLAYLAMTFRLHGRPLYMSISGGYGQLYELAFIMLARLRGIRIFLHHHSFAYLNVPSILTRWLTYVSGADATHITLSSGMAEQLKSTYGVEHSLVVSNAVFFPFDNATVSIRRRLEIIGFLSNISREKGIFEFLDLMAEIQEAGLPLRARLAGPFQDSETERVVRERLVALPMVEYIGPKYGMEKDSFYSSIDVLVFPTSYRNEAEPMTIHEAMSCGVPVIAYGRGSIPEIIGPSSGLVVAPSSPFVPAAFEQIETWLNRPMILEAASKAAVESFAKTYAESMLCWQALLNHLAGYSVATSRINQVNR